MARQQGAAGRLQPKGGLAALRGVQRAQHRYWICWQQVAAPGASQGALGMASPAGSGGGEPSLQLEGRSAVDRAW